MTYMSRTNFRFPYPWRLNTKFGLVGQVVSEKTMFEHCIRTDNRQMPEHGYTKSSPGELSAQVS